MAQLDLSQLVDVAAEAGVIASLIYHPTYLLVDNVLRPKFFSSQDNQCLFWAIEQLVTSGVTNIDPLNLNNILHSEPGVWKVMERYDLTDTSKYIALCEKAARPSYEEYKLLADNVITYAFRRDLYRFSSDLGKECFNTEISLDDLNDYVNGGISNIVERFIFGGDSVLFGEKVDDIWQEIVDNRNDDGSYGLPSKLPSLNEYITYCAGELTLIAGPTGEGKSSWMLNEGMFALQRGTTVFIDDTELTDKVFLPRALANLSGVTVKKIKSGEMLQSEEQAVTKAREWLKSQPFVHQFDPVFNKMKIEQMARKWKNQKNLGLFIYDYIKPSERYGAADISQNLGLMADFLKILAGNLEIPVIAGLQLNKLTGTVADSQKPERYCDSLLFWREKNVEELRKDTLECGNYKIEVIKNRNGSLTGEDDYIDVMFQRDLMRISEAKKHTVDDLPFEGGTANDTGE